MAAIEPMRVGVIGCGNISGVYFKAGQRFPALDIVACADLIHERAQRRAAEFDIPNPCSVEKLLADESIDIVLNLTTPDAHFSVCLAALEAGKSVHVEKPLSITREEGRKLVELAKSKGLRLGAAPDTFLGGGHQTCRKLIDDGAIGEPIGATAFMLCHGHESWHPDPEFYYKVGGGPMFDMGPYYLTALVNLIGAIVDVTGVTRITFPQRTITSEAKSGTIIDVDVPTHVAGIMRFANGAVGTILTSFDAWHSELPRIEIYGSEGSLSVPDPNTFGGPVRIRGKSDSEWRDVPLTHGYADNSRGIGVADMAYAIQSGRPHRANGDLGYHVLEAMHGFQNSSDTRSAYKMTSDVERPAALPVGLTDGELDV